MKYYVLIFSSIVFFIMPMVEAQPVTDQTTEQARHIIESQLKLQPVMRGKFTQRKTLTILKKPLTSSGNFLATEKKGLYWRQQSPFLSETLVTNDFLAQRIREGEVKQYSTEEQPLLNNIFRVFLAVWRGDINTLNESFESQIKTSSHGWKMILIPTDMLMKKAVSKIIVQGSEYIERVELQEGSGNLTEISISGVTGSHKLSENELGLFSWP